MDLTAAGRLRSRIADVCRRGVDAPLDDDGFGALARDVFRHQLRHNAAYAAYCRRRGVDGDVEHWSRIPAVPTAAFKELPLVSGDPDAARLVFRTSGTSRGRERRGEHRVLDPDLYDASLIPSFQAHLLPDRDRILMVSLIPAWAEQPDSSLSYMVDRVMAEFGAEGSRHVASVAHGLDVDALRAVIGRAGDEPVCLLGTTAAFIHWLDALERDGALRLPPGSRLMDTGGYKGRGREVPEDELRRAYAGRLGLDPASCINEYGMTELLSQFYDSTLRDLQDGVADPMARRRKLGPPWVRTVVVDPESLEPAPDADTGILAHYDLANVDSVLAIQTEDLGRRREDGFELLGRSAGAPPRGCSLAMDLLLRAAEEDA